MRVAAEPVVLVEEEEVRTQVQQEASFLSLEWVCKEAKVVRLA